MPLNPDQILAGIQQATDSMANTLGANPGSHGMLRGTFEAALAEAQGAELIKGSNFTPSVQAYNHYQSMRDAANGLANNLSSFRQLLMQLRGIDPRAADAVQRSLRPLTEMASQRLEMAQKVDELINEINTTGNATRLQGVPLNQGRDAAGLVSNQLNNLRLGLVPQQLAQSFSALMDRIKELPATLEEAQEQIRTMAVTVSSVAAAAARGAARAAQAAVSRSWTAAMEFLAAFGSRLTSFIIIPTKMLKSMGSGGVPEDA
jgi:hypothetical protein